MAVAIGLGGALERDRDTVVPDCSACRGPEFAPNRIAWACDEPRADGRAVWKISCECAGRADCARPDCEGGWRPVMRCPHALLRTSGLGEFFRSYGLYREHGILPGPGGLYDQPASWLQAVSVADHERGVWDQERDDWMREERERTRPKGMKS